MTARHYSLSADTAVAGSTAGFQRITQSGAYTGVFTKAKHIKASTGAEGVEFTFKARDGAEAGYLTLYTHNGQGGETYGYSQLNALMACLKVREINPQSMQVLEYDHDAGKEQAVQIDAYPQLMHAPVGVVLQREEYRKRDGDVGERMNLHAFFEADTRQTGGEVIQQKPAGAIDGVIANLKDKTLPGNQPGSVRAPRPAGMPATVAEGSVSGQRDQALQDFDDDIPF